MMNHKIVLTFVAFLTIQSLVTTFGSFAQLDEPNQSESAGETNVSMDLTSIFPIVAMIKGQVKEIVLDLVSQVFQYIRAIVQECKVRLLKRLGKYTLSDVFHLVFDGVIEFVNDETTMSTTTENFTESTTKTTTTVQASNENVYDSESSRRIYDENPNDSESSRRVYDVNPYLWSLYQK